MRYFLPCVLLVIALPNAGCNRGETNEERLRRLVPDALSTTEVNGRVTVDGSPVKNLWVTLHPIKGDGTLLPKGQTDVDGNFQITTYIAGDGAPEGDYKITIEWLTYIKRDSDWGGPDKLKNLYNDPATTAFEVTVGDEPVELPTFELKLEGVEGKPAPSQPAGYKREK